MSPNGPRMGDTARCAPYKEGGSRKITRSSVCGIFPRGQNMIDTIEHSFKVDDKLPLKVRRHVENFHFVRDYFVDYESVCLSLSVMLDLVINDLVEVRWIFLPIDEF